ncbi:MAG: transcription antitermination factor NusB [Planctomycetota bacterium]|jgi:16S rRNA (cytosine967-C5)-methyltransferase
MKPNLSTDVRRLVWQLLCDDREFPTRALDVAMEEQEFDPRDRALAKQMLAGVQRAQVTLEKISRAYATRRVKEGPLQQALNLGLYQLLYLDRIPQHAAIDATLNAVKPELSPKTGFLNALLRGVARSAKPARPGLQEARDRLPSPPWQFDRKVFLDPKTDGVGFLAETEGYSRFLIKRWWEDVGEERTRERAATLNRKAALWLRVNPLRSGAEDVVKALESAGVEVEIAEEENMLQVMARKVSAPLPQWPGFEQGHWSVQDITSYRSLAMGRPAAGERILDLCAAPGGKSFAAHEISGGEAEILACDVSAARLEQLEAEAARLGHQIRTQVIDPEGKDLPPGPWDLLLCDVPCSNTGVLHKRPEARARFSKVELHKVVTMQNLLRKRLVLPSLSENTRVLWTTCSLEVEENQEASARLAKASDREAVEEQLFEPSASQAGGYAALVGASA